MLALEEFTHRRHREVKVAQVLEIVDELLKVARIECLLLSREELDVRTKHLSILLYLLDVVLVRIDRIRLLVSLYKLLHHLPTVLRESHILESLLSISTHLSELRIYTVLCHVLCAGRVQLTHHFQVFLVLLLQLSCLVLQVFYLLLLRDDLLDDLVKGHRVG